jgi:murein DD-endopeptidase MepM/ murein hydrolase activator NlpD
VTACAALLAPASAHAQASPVAAPAPAVTSFACADDCGATGLARSGSLLRVRGKILSRASEVLFLGAPGAQDDVAAATTVRRRASVDVRVPVGAVAGPVAVVGADGVQSAPTDAPLALDVSAPGSLRSTIASVDFSVRSPRAYYDAEQPAGLDYVLRAPAPTSVAIDLQRVSDGATVMRWNVPSVTPDVVQHLTWDGTAGGRIQRNGQYAFHVSAGATALVAGPPAQQATFAFGRDEFPIVGTHVFGTGTAAFGGPRGHQGQDTFAECGTPLVAAHGGTVKFAGYEGRAGNYVVIDNDGVGTSYVYMHLRDAALVSTGDHVLTGQPIGVVGQTGDASACHLHFEIWTAPGWYQGGQPIDPLPSLKAWDRG